MGDLATEKTRDDLNTGRRCRLLTAVVVGIALCLRNLWLMAGGGGIAPRPLLAFETAAWWTAALGGALALSQSADDTTRTKPDRLERWAGAGFAVAAAAHGVRLIIYTQKRVLS